jgi:hypothetical protein
MSNNTTPVTVPCKHCVQGVVIVEVPTTGSEVQNPLCVAQNATKLLSTVSI